MLITHKNKQVKIINKHHTKDVSTMLIIIHILYLVFNNISKYTPFIIKINFS
jgi:hypothetical protein